MSKNTIVGVAVVLCVIAAGIGAFFASRPEPVQISAPEAGVSVSADLIQSGGSPVAMGTEGVITDVPPAAPVTSPTVRPAPVGRTNSGQAPVAPVPATPAPPASQQPADSTWTGLEKPWPSGTASAPPATSVPPAEPPVPLPPPEPQFEELVVTADSVLGLVVDSNVNSETARVEDTVEAHVTREVRVGSYVAVPANSRVLGSVSQVEKGGKMKTKARLGVRFHTLVLADGTRTPIQTDLVFREGDSPGQEAAGKVGAAAAGGAILGAILGGGKGAAIGGSIGAAGGTAAVMAGKRNPALLKAGTQVTVRLLQPVTVMVER